MLNGCAYNMLFTFFAISSAVPFMAQLSASLPPDVKYSSLLSQPIALAVAKRASSRALCAFDPYGADSTDCRKRRKNTEPLH